MADPEGEASTETSGSSDVLPGRYYDNWLIGSDVLLRDGSPLCQAAARGLIEKQERRLREQVDLVGRMSARCLLGFVLHTQGRRRAAAEQFGLVLKHCHGQSTIAMHYLGVLRVEPPDVSERAPALMRGHDEEYLLRSYAAIAMHDLEWAQKWADEHWRSVSKRVNGGEQGLERVRAAALIARWLVYVRLRPVADRAPGLFAAFDEMYDVATNAARDADGEVQKEDWRQVCGGLCVLNATLCARYYGVTEEEPKLVESALDILDAAFLAGLVDENQNGGAHVARGKVLQQLGRHYAAQLAFRQAMRVDPLSPVVLCCLASSLTAAGKIDEARLYWRRLYETVRYLHGRKSFYMWQYALFLLERGDQQRCLVIVEEGIAAIVKGDFDEARVRARLHFVGFECDKHEEDRTQHAWAFMWSAVHVKNEWKDEDLERVREVCRVACDAAERAGARGAAGSDPWDADVDRARLMLLWHALRAEGETTWPADLGVSLQKLMSSDEYAGQGACERLCDIAWLQCYVLDDMAQERGDEPRDILECIDKFRASANEDGMADDVAALIEKRRKLRRFLGARGKGSVVFRAEYETSTKTLATNGLAAKDVSDTKWEAIDHVLAGDRNTRWISFTSALPVAVMYWAQAWRTNGENRVLLGVDLDHRKARVWGTFLSEDCGRDSKEANIAGRRMTAHREVVLEPAGGRFPLDVICRVYDLRDVLKRETKFAKHVVEYLPRKKANYPKFAPRWLDLRNPSGQTMLQRYGYFGADAIQLLREWGACAETMDSAEQSDSGSQSGASGGVGSTWSDSVESDVAAAGQLQ